MRTPAQEQSAARWDSFWPSRLSRRKVSRSKCSVPRYDSRLPSNSLSSRIKAALPRVGTRPELSLQTALTNLDIKYRKNVTDLPGVPDIVLAGGRVVVFVDGDFWHGRNWSSRIHRLKRGANARYWIDKIAYNRARDKQTSALLRRQGWTVVRVWESDVRSDAFKVALRIQSLLHP